MRLLPRHDPVATRLLAMGDSRRRQQQPEMLHPLPAIRSVGPVRPSEYLFDEGHYREASFCQYHFHLAV